MISDDRPAQETEIEITPEMMEAGRLALIAVLGPGAARSELDLEDEAVKEVFAAMLAKQQSAQK